MRKILFGTACGLVFSIVVWVLWPHRYISTAVGSFHFGVNEHPDEQSKQKVRNFMETTRSATFSDAILSRIAQREGVLADTLKANLGVRAVENSAMPDRLKELDSIMCCWEISFTATQQDVAQHVTHDLLVEFFNARPLFPQPACPIGDCSGPNFQPWETASVGRDLKPPLWQFAMTGVAIGAVLSLFIRVYPRPNR